MSGIPQLETERLILRALHKKNFDAMAQFFASPWSQSAGGPFDSGQVRRALLLSAGHWPLRAYGLWYALSTSSTKYGYCGFIVNIEWPETELAWEAYGGSEGKGFNYEAALAALAVSLALFVHQPISLIDPDNAHSRRLAERFAAWVETKTLLLNKPVVIYAIRNRRTHK